MNNLAEIVSELRATQRLRRFAMGDRIAHGNRLQAHVAVSLGYTPNLTEKERDALFDQAQAIIDEVDAFEKARKAKDRAVDEMSPKKKSKAGSLPRSDAKGKAQQPFPEMAGMILASLEGIKALECYEAKVGLTMTKLAKQLPVAEWTERPDQAGFGLLQLGQIIGEAGDLSNYSTCAKLWRRMGCAPWTFDGHTRMAATWRIQHKGEMTSEQWSDYGYSPRRRSIAYNIGISLRNMNKTGPYRAKYDREKARAQETHPDWTPMHVDRHAMLLTTKLLLENLWKQWRAGANGAVQNSQHGIVTALHA